ncbi:MAG: M36 family metallopeptidase [Bacteroidetes bacterium]|nr:M36 family metallopeptidase [Bacteroidota bacterium]
MKKFTAVAALVCCTITLLAQVPEMGIKTLVKSIDHVVFEEGTYKLQRDFTDKHNGVSHAYGYQTHNGLEIEGTHFNVHAQNGQIVSKNLDFVGKGLLLKAGEHQIEKDAVLSGFMSEFEEQFGALPHYPAVWKEISQNQFEIVDANISPDPIRIKKTYAAHDGDVVPSWSLSFSFKDGSHWYYSIYNAETGLLIDRNDWTISCNVEHDHSAHAFNLPLNPTPTDGISFKKADGAQYNVFAQPIESPNHGDIALIKDPAIDKASPYGWHDTDGVAGPEYTITAGNNTYAQEDRDGNNFTLGYSPDGTSSLSFNFPYSKSGDWNDNQDAAITNLFYWTNLMHDIWWHYGFNEESGNFQQNNYGNASSGAGDALNAQAQDGSGLNNANMATPPDGTSPRMQMYMWGGINGQSFIINAPSQQAGLQQGTLASFGPRLDQNIISGKLVLVNDGSTNGAEGCDSLLNAAALKGNIALIARGTCQFVQKVRNAQAAGAVAAIVYNNQNGPSFAMAGTGPDITIPSIMITRTLGTALQTELENNLSFNVELYDSTGFGGFDSDFDGGIIAHEFTHGISTRLTGGADNSNCLTGQMQMGEGWSDYFTLVMTQTKNHTATTPRGIGTYVSDQPITGGGIRPAPYTTRVTGSPYVFSNTANLAAPHGVGAVWCAMLWDLHWKMIDKYGFDEDLINGTGGNNICVQLVLDAMKLQPCNPSFSDARDAIILADKLNNGGANEKLIWEAFAGRGLGENADEGDPNDKNDNTNGFDLPPKYNGYVSITKSAPEQVLESEGITYTITIENASDVVYKNVVIVDTIPSQLSFNSVSAECKWTVNGNIVTLTLDELQPEEKLTCSFDCTINAGEYAIMYLEDGCEEDNEKWLTETTIGDAPWIVQSNLFAEGSACWFAQNAGATGDQSLLLNVGKVGDNSILSFQHYFNLREIGANTGDGGVIEISEDGQTWIDAELYFIENGYNGEINNTSSPIQGHAAFIGNSQEFITSTIDLSKWANKEIIVKFRFAEDRGRGVDGWYVDDVKVMRDGKVTNTIYSTHNGKESTSSATTLIIDDRLDSDGRNFGQSNTAQVYPNPAKNHVNVWLKMAENNANIIISDLSGKTISTHNAVRGNNSISINTLPAGTYLVRIETIGSSQHYYFVKE